MSLRDDYKELMERLRKRRLESGAVLVPNTHTLWLHLETDKIYEVVQMVKGSGVLHGEVLVLYRNPMSSETFVRPLNDWHMHFVNVDKQYRQRLLLMRGSPVYVEEHECVFEKGGKPHRRLSISHGRNVLGMMGPEALKLFYRLLNMDERAATENPGLEVEQVSAELEDVLAHQDEWEPFGFNDSNQVVESEKAAVAVMNLQDAPEVPVDIDEINCVSPGAGIID